MGAAGGAWGQSAKPAAAAVDELERLSREALALLEEGKYGEALPLAKRMLDIQEKLLGPKHPDVASSLDVLATLYRLNGDYARAERLHLRALGIREKVLGPEHPNVAQSLGNLALLYQKKGNDARAEALFQRGLYIQKR